MIVDATFSYEAEHRLRRKRRAEKGNFRATVPVEVREVDIERAPVALWWRSVLRMDVPGLLAVRSIDGELYEPYRLDEEGIDAVIDGSGSAMRGGVGTDAKIVTAEGVRALSGRRMATLLGQAVPANGRELPTIQDLDVAEVISSNFDSAQANARAAYGRLRLVGGFAYRRIDCPMVTVDNLLSPSIKLDYANGFQNRCIATTFRIDRFADARSVYLTALRAQQGLQDRNGTEFDHLMPEIVDASLIAFDEARHVVDISSRQLLAVLSNRSGRDWPPAIASEPRAMLIAFARLRDLRDADAPTIDIVEAMRAVLRQPSCASERFRKDAEVAAGVVRRLEAEGVVPDEVSSDMDALGI